MTDIKKLKEASAKLREQITASEEKIAAANVNNDEVISSIAQSLSYLRDQVWNMEDRMYEFMWKHEDGHLPKITSASAMEKLLAAAGMENDFEVGKKYVSVASDRKGGAIAEVAFTK
jgi:hypothetical protein